MNPHSFFDETEEQSAVKARIVAKYFWSWAKVIMPHARDGNIAYIDLFAGPGRYKDGARSTPLLILERAIADPVMRTMLVSIFNDRDHDHAEALRRAIGELPGLGNLRHAPEVWTREVGSEIADLFERTRLIPTFFFVDPWGYKGLSLRLVNAVLANWGCDCVFFFNYNRINMGLGNQAVREHMAALFGDERAAELRVRLIGLSSEEREWLIVEELSQALRELGRRYVLPFRFRNASGGRTSHHLIFVTKHLRGYGIMKEIMAAEGQSAGQGVGAFEYNPATIRQPLLFEYARPLDALADMLLDHFAGRRLTMQQVFEEHNVGRPYIGRNYKEALLKLEEAGAIATNPPAGHPRRRRGTFAGHVMIKFPKRR